MAVNQPSIVNVNSGKFIDYKFEGNVIILNDGDLSINLAKREKDYDVTLDVVMDNEGTINVFEVNGTSMSYGSNQRYIMQIKIPARRYILDSKQVVTDPQVNDNNEVVVPSTSFDYSFKQAVPFEIGKSTIYLWAL